MTLRKKTLLIIGATLACLFAIVYLFSSYILLGGFAGVERDETIDNVQQANHAITSEVEAMAAQARDWSFWDDTYLFIEDRNQKYIDSNLDADESFVNQQLNFMIFVNNSGEIVFSREFDLLENEFLPASGFPPALLAENPSLLEHADEEDGKSGVIMFSGEPVLVTSQAIVTSRGEGPVRGSLVWGRYLDQSQVDAFADLTHLPLEVLPVADEQLPEDYQLAYASMSDAEPDAVHPLNDNTIAGYMRIDDIYGEPALLLRVSLPREVYDQGQSSMHYFLYTLGVIGLVFIVTILLLLERLVLARVSRLSDEVMVIGNQGDHSARVHVNGDDELGLLGDVINNMLEALEKSQSRLRDLNLELDTKVQERTLELREKIAALKALADVEHEVNTAMHTQPLLDMICRRAADLLAAPKAIIALRGVSGCELTTTYGFSVSPESDSSLEQHMQKYLTRQCAEIFSSTQGIVDSKDRRSCDFYRDEDIRSFVRVPLELNGSLLGVIELFDDEPRQWNGGEVQVLELLAGQLTQALERSSLFEQEQERREELGLLYDLSRELNDIAPNIDAALTQITKHAVINIHVTFAAVALVEDCELYTRVSYPVRILDYELSTGNREPLRSMPFIQNIMGQKTPVVINKNNASLNGVEQTFIFPDPVNTVCIVPLRSEEQAIGIMILGEERDSKREPFVQEKINLASSIGDQTTSALKRAELFNEIEEGYLQTVLALANAVDAKDSYTAGHGERMSNIAQILGRKLGLKDQQLHEMRYCAILHDVGKIGIPDAILQKPGPLNSQEWSQMRKHPTIGEQIVSPIQYLAGALKVVRHHHERYDGTGYPDGLAADDIPLGSRILAVADSYCAMTDERVYKHAISHDEAVTELKENAGSQFDPDIVAVFVESFRTDIAAA